MIFNGSSVGRINLFSDNSSVQDGLLDIVILRNGKMVETLKILNEFEDGKFVNNDNVAYLKEKKFKISLVEGKCTTTDADGDEGPMLPFDVECVEKGIDMFM
jgi:diacylglycerol kinase (ATP)